MSEYIIRVNENDERWHYVEQQYTYFFGYPITDEIVRCRDCKFAYWDIFAWWCTRDKYQPFEIGELRGERDEKSHLNGFCAWGERRDGE